MRGMRNKSLEAEVVSWERSWNLFMAWGPSSWLAWAMVRGLPMVRGEIIGREVDLLAPHA